MWVGVLIVKPDSAIYFNVKKIWICKQCGKLQQKWCVFKILNISEIYLFSIPYFNKKPVCSLVTEYICVSHDATSGGTDLYFFGTLRQDPLDYINVCKTFILLRQEAYYFHHPTSTTSMLGKCLEPVPTSHSAVSIPLGFAGAKVSLCVGLWCGHNGQGHGRIPLMAATPL